MKTDSPMNLRSLVIFDCLTVTLTQLEPRKMTAGYTVLKPDGTSASTEFIYSYDEAVFDPKNPTDLNLASMMAAQVAINYGLFCREIVFAGLYDAPDRNFIVDMTENTCREIFVNKFLMPNEFLVPPFDSLKAEKHTRFTAAKLTFDSSGYDEKNLVWNHADTDPNRTVILSSGGKDSLLSYGIMKEIGHDVHPIFINESGRHWFTALNAYRNFRSTESNTGRVWCNSDRVFNWMLRQMPFIRQDFASIRADNYPIRLWTVAVFLFGVLPLARKRKAQSILIGNEYDTTLKMNYQGITHYAALYDQSKYFDNALTRYYLKKGWRMNQFSILRSLSELLIMKILVNRFPDLQRHQVSCHAAHEKDGRIYPCGKCEKCRRIVGMLKSLDGNPADCGYTEEQISQSLRTLEQKSVKQIGSDAGFLYYLLLEKNLIARNTRTEKLARHNDFILKMRFDRERSNLRDLPRWIRRPLLKLFSEHADGAVQMQRHHWQPIDILNSEQMDQPYPFEFETRGKAMDETPGYRPEFMWEYLTWEKIQERLKTVDTAILPCGAIEQHGPHLPVDVDYFDAVYLARKVAEACSEPRPFVLPGIPFGVSYHHEDFKGTLSVTNTSMAQYVYDLGCSLARNGIKKLILLNGHGDNAPTLKFAAQMINRDQSIFVCVETGETSDKDLYELIDTPNDVHAGEIETSTTMALRPDLVEMGKALKETMTFGSNYLDFTSARGVPWYVRTNRISTSGVMGDPTKASAEKGRKMWEIMIAQLVKFVEEVKKSRLEDLYQKRY